MRYLCEVDGISFTSCTPLFLDILNGKAVYFEHKATVKQVSREDWFYFKKIRHHNNIKKYKEYRMIIEEQKSGYLVYIAKVKEQAVEVELLNGETKLVQYSEIYKK